MSIHVGIVDDESLAIQEMELLLSDYSEIEICGTAHDAPSAITLINRQKPDLVFLDIQLKDINAFTILEQLHELPHIVFVTAYNEFATRAFEINALDYLMKPVNPLRLKDTIDRYQQKTPIPPPKSNMPYKYNDRLIVTEKNEYKLITISDICYVQSDGDYTQVHLHNGKKKMILKTMNDWETLLPNEFFTRIHRATIVNIEMIDRIEKSFNNTCKVYLKNYPTGLQMSQRYTAKFINRYKA